MSWLSVSYGATIFLSAFLLFQVQPIIGKIILPWFGGPAAVWTTCLVFFQTLLLLGYLYAHWSIRALSPRIQGVLHASLLGASLLMLPITPGEGWKPLGSEEPVWRILGLLTASVGLPYFVLSTTGPLLQAWFAREKAGTVPYRLFALSNLGSMLALLSYPLAFEPVIRTRLQSLGWSLGYVLFVGLCALLALRGMTERQRATAPVPAEGERPTRRDHWRWMALAVCPSLLLLAVTSHLTQDIAPVPFLWVLPLALYLLSFILCFEGSGWYRRPIYVPLFLLGVAGMIYALARGATADAVKLAVPIFVVALFTACMVCHGELARRKPDPAFLTGFYLMIALGGAIGGLFVALIAPRIFNDHHEVPYAIVATAIVVVALMVGDVWPWTERYSLPVGWIALTVIPVIFCVVDAAIRPTGDVEIKRRNFYGTLRIVEAGADDHLHRKLFHGVVTHGHQFLATDRRKWPTTYYAEESGAGLAILRSRTPAAQRVGLIGLGAGTLAAYSRPGDSYRFYEINPLVVEMARSRFSYLRDASGTIELVLGDARLSLERESAQRFDVLIVDAFSGDAIPVHLLTREAFAQYVRHLAPGGVLAIHVSNHHLDLGPIVKLAADHYGKQAIKIASPDDDDRGAFSADWVLVADDEQYFASRQLLDEASEIEVDPGVRAWTDDYSSLLPILRVLTGRKSR